MSTDFLDENVNLKRKVAIQDYSVTCEFSLADKISSSYSKLAPNLSIGFGYKNRSVEVGTKSEDGYRVTYVKEHNQVQQDYATVKTTNETGVRTVDHLQRTFDYAVDHGEQILKAGKVVVATVFVLGAIIYGVTVSASTFGFGVSIAAPVIASAFLYLSSTMEDNGEGNIK